MPDKDSDLIALVYRGIENSDYDNSTQREAIEQSDDFYFGRAPGGSGIAGRSQSVSMDVMNTVSATTAAVLEGFIGESVAAFQPQGDQDEQPAEIESKAISDAISDAGGFMVYQNAIESSLRYTNTCVRAWIDKSPKQETQRLPEAGKADAAQVVAAFPDEFEAEMEPMKDGGFKIIIQRPNSELRLEVVNMARIIIRKDWPHLDISEIDFFGIEHEDSRQDMIGMGFSKAIVDKLPEGREFFTEGAVRSKLQGEEVSYTDAPDRSQQLITWFEIWVTVAGERSRVAVSHRKLLDETPATMIPCLLGASYPQAHRWQGISLASKIEPIMVSKTEILRQYEDNLAAGNVPSMGAYDVNTDDLTDGRINGIKRYNSPNARLEPIPVQDLGPSSLTALQYQDKQRSEAGGTALDLESPESQLMDSQIGAVAAQQTLLNQEVRATFIARNIAETVIKPLYLITHRLLREEFDGPITVRMADQFVQVDPSTWQPRTRVQLMAGLAPSQRQRRASNLMTVVQLQSSLLQAGSPLVNAADMHNSLQAWGWTVDLPVNQFFTDPNSEQGQQAAQQQQQQQQQAQQMQAQIEQIPAMIAQMKEQASTERNTQDNEVKLKIAGIQAELDEAKLTLDGISQAQDREAQLINGSTQNGG